MTAAQNRFRAFVDLMFSHDGRIGRLQYWVGLIATAGITAFLVGLADGVVPAREIMRYAAVAFIIGALFWMHSAVTVKRLHDRNRTGMWFFIHGVAPPGFFLWAVYMHADNKPNTASLLYALSLSGFIWALFELGLLRGTVGPNRFGADPRAVRQSGFATQANKPQ